MQSTCKECAMPSKSSHKPAQCPRELAQACTKPRECEHMQIHAIHLQEHTTPMQAHASLCEAQTCMHEPSQSTRKSTQCPCEHGQSPNRHMQPCAKHVQECAKPARCHEGSNGPFPSRQFAHFCLQCLGKCCRNRVMGNCAMLKQKLRNLLWSDLQSRK